MHENVCVVGDDAQSIYSFRGATIENILQFQKDYDEVKLVKLEQNYRSTQNILHVANEVIANNKNQIEKKLFTINAEGEKISLVRTMTDNDEGKMVADTIQEQNLRNHYYNKDFAILYRTNAQSRSFEEALRRMGIAYRIYGGMSFYQRKEVKDFIAFQCSAFITIYSRIADDFPYAQVIFVGIQHGFINRCFTNATCRKIDDAF